MFLLQIGFVLATFFCCYTKLIARFKCHLGFYVPFNSQGHIGSWDRSSALSIMGGGGWGGSKTYNEDTACD